MIFPGNFKLLTVETLAKFIIYLSIGVFLVGVFAFFLGGDTASKYLDNPDEQVIQSSEYFNVNPQDKKTAALFDLGLYVDSIYNLDLANLSFNARGWLWYTWNKAPLIEGKEESKENIGIFDFNINEESRSSQVKLIRDPYFEDGEYWSETAFDAKFAANKLNLRNFPFDRQELQIIVTSNIHTTDELILNPTQFRLPSKAFNITGYRLDGITMTDTVRIYSSNFSDASEVNWRNRMPSVRHSQSAATTQSQPIYSIYISRDIFSSFMKYVFALLIVSLLATFVSLLSRELSVTKLSAPPAAILSLILLQNSFVLAVPRTPYLTLMDLLFLMAFLACFLSFLNSLLECLDRNYARYKFLFERLGIVVILISPFVVKTWLELNA
jgi:hypothetical protein